MDCSTFYVSTTLNNGFNSPLLDINITIFEVHVRPLGK